jgi:serine/threonine protein kinase
MGAVYEANDTRLNRQVALKVLPAKMANNPEWFKRFEREAQAVAALNHPNIVTIHSVEEAGDVHFIILELVGGKTLDALIPAGGFPVEQFFDIAIPLTDAIAAAISARWDFFLKKRRARGGARRLVRRSTMLRLFASTRTISIA